MRLNKTTGKMILIFISGLGVGSIIWHLCSKFQINKTSIPNSSNKKEKGDIYNPDNRLQIDHLLEELDEKKNLMRKLEQKNKELVDEFKRYKNEHEKLSEDIRDNERVAVFRALEPVLTQIPVVIADVNSGVDITAPDLARLMKMIPIRMKSVGIEMIGDVNQQVGFDPAIHQLLASETNKLDRGHQTVIIVPGFKYQDQILTRAEVEPIEAENG